MSENAILSRHTSLWVRRKVEEGQAENDWTAIGRLTNIPAPSPESEEIDISALDSPGTDKEFMAGPTDNGSIELSGQYKAGEAGQRLLEELYKTKETFEFKIVAPAQTGVALPAQYKGEAYLSSCKPFGDAVEGDILPFNATLRVTGKMDFTREYLTDETAPDVESTPASGTTFSSSLTVKLDSKIGNGDIYYVTDNTTPTTSSTKYTSAGITVSATTTIKAINAPDGLTASSVKSFTFTKQ